MCSRFCLHRRQTDVALTAVESYNFSYYEDLFAEETGAKTPVNVLAKSYRNVQLHNPGKYDVVLTYNDGSETRAQWEVLPLADCKKAKNVIFFLGDGVSRLLTADLIDSGPGGGVQGRE